MYNKYAMYSYAAGDLKNACDDKILVDLQKLKNLTEFLDVEEFVNANFGEVEDYKEISYPNNIMVYILHKDNEIKICAAKNEEQIFGRGWIFHPDKEN